jgi:hypothetical protein
VAALMPAAPRPRTERAEPSDRGGVVHHRVLLLVLFDPISGSS